MLPAKNYLCVIVLFVMGLFPIGIAIAVTDIQPIVDQSSGAVDLPAGADDLSPGADELPLAPAARFEQYLMDTVVPDVPGAAVAVVVDGQLKLIKGFGVRRAGGQPPVTLDTVFRLASVSKTIAASAAGILVKGKHSHWDARVTEQLQGLRFKNAAYGQQITLEALLSHTSGLMPHAYTNLIEDNVSYQKVLKRLNKVDFICPPGTCYGYQNVVFSLVGDVIQASTGQSYEDFVAEQLFDPLGMRNASFGLNAFVNSDNRAIPHVKRQHQWTPVKVARNYYNVAPAAGANASISDMAQWLLAHLGQRQEVLPDVTLAQLHAKKIKTTRRQAHYRRQKALGDTFYGLGWRIFDYAGHSDFVHHGGWVEGARAEVVFNRKLQTGMVFLTNAETPHAGRVVFKFLEMFQDYLLASSGQKEVMSGASPAS